MGIPQLFNDLADWYSSAFASAPSPLPPPSHSSAPDCKPDVLIVKLTADVPIAAALKYLREELGLPVEGAEKAYHSKPTPGALKRREVFGEEWRQKHPLPNLSRIFKLKFRPGSDIRRLADIIKELPFVESADLIGKIKPTLEPNDPYSVDGTQWHLDNIGAYAAWDKTTGSSDVTVAIVDTGVKYDHPDLQANLWTNPGETAGDGLDNDGNGYIDDVLGWNFKDGNNDTLDYLNHGTRMAGAAAAVSNNSIGVAGVSWGARIMPIRYNELTTGEEFIYAADNISGPCVINASICGLVNNMSAAISYAVNMGCVLVASAGNGSSDTTCYPGGDENVLNVGATDSGENLAAFNATSNSNFGPEVAVYAPGAMIYTTDSRGEYSFSSGTSISSPVAAGIAALVLSVNPSLTPRQVDDIIGRAAEHVMPGPCRGYSDLCWDYAAGWGRVNAYNAVSLAAQDPLPPPLPQARIFSPNGGFYNSPAVVTAGTLTVAGRAKGENFDHYNISWGRGAAPTEWFTTGVTLADGGTSPVSSGTLGTVVLNEPGLITVRLKVLDNEGNNAYSPVVLRVDPSLRSGYPRAISGVLSSLSAPDVDSDGFGNLFVGTAKTIAGFDRAGKYLNGWQGTQSLYGGIRNNIGERFVTAGDINGDGALEIVSAEREIEPTYGDKIYAWQSSGAALSQWPDSVPLASPENITGLMLEDLDADGRQDIVAGGKQLYAFNYGAASLSGWPVIYGNGQVLGCAAGDLFRDGTPELAAAVNLPDAADVLGNHLYNNQGAELLNSPFHAGDYTYDKVALADIDGDYISEIFSYGNYDGNKGFYALRYLNDDFTVLWNKDYQIDSLAFGDVNGDGAVEIAAAGETGTHLLDQDGNELAGWPQAAASQVLIGDVDGDALPDVVTIKDNVISAYQANGALIAAFPKYTTGAVRSALLGNIDGSGRAELAAVDDSRLYRWDLGFTYDPASYPWPLPRHDIRGTNNYDSDITPPEISPTIPARATIGKAIDIPADIYDANGVIRSRLYYRTDPAGAFQPLEMSDTGGTSWAGSIPADLTAAGGIVQLYFVAHDRYFNPGMTPLGAASYYYEVPINKVSDTKAPTIYHQAITSAYMLQDLAVSAGAVDNTVVSSMLLYYQLAGSSSWKALQMAKTSQSPSSQTLDLADWWLFDGAVRDTDETIVFQGNAVDWYFGGAGVDLPSDISPYSGLLFDIKGTAGKVKLELIGRDKKTYIYEASADNARYLYVRFADFRKEIGGLPAGAAFSKDTGASQVRVIAVGKKSDGPVDFTLRQAFLLALPPFQAEYNAVIPGKEINRRADLRYYLTAADPFAHQASAPAAAEYYTVTVIDNIAPAVPANLRVAGSGDGWATLEWEAPADKDLAGYEVRYRSIDGDQDSSWQKIKVDSSKGEKIKLDELTAGLSYQFQVRAYDDAPQKNYSDWSNLAFAYSERSDAGQPDSGPADGGFIDAGEDAAPPDASVPSRRPPGGCGCSVIGY